MRALPTDNWQSRMVSDPSDPEHGVDVRLLLDGRIFIAVDDDVIIRSPADWHALASARVVPCRDLHERAERMREHILRKVVSRLCDVPTGKWHGEWGCGLCGGLGKGPASGEYDHSLIEHTADCMVAPLAESARVVEMQNTEERPEDAARRMARQIQELRDLIARRDGIIRGLREEITELKAGVTSQVAHPTDCPICEGGHLYPQQYLQCDKCEAELLADGMMTANAALRPRPSEPIEATIKHYEAEECRFDDPARCAVTAMRYVDTMPPSHVRALLYTLARAASVPKMECSKEPVYAVWGWWDHTDAALLEFPERAERAKRAGHRLTTLFTPSTGKRPASSSKVDFPALERSTYPTVTEETRAPVMTDLCANCHTNFGQHHGLRCPSGQTMFERATPSGVPRS